MVPVRSHTAKELSSYFNQLAEFERFGVRRHVDALDRGPVRALQSANPFVRFSSDVKRSERDTHGIITTQADVLNADLLAFIKG